MSVQYSQGFFLILSNLNYDIYIGLSTQLTDEIVWNNVIEEFANKKARKVTL